MSELRELYQTVILDHYRAPRNFGPLAGATASAQGFNPLCGDRVRVHVRVADDVVEEVRFEGSGCAISKASASLMTEAVRGKREGDVQRLFAAFHQLLTGGDAPTPPTLGKLEVLSGVREFPIRVKCATLAWHALRQALDGRGEPVTTE